MTDLETEVKKTLLALLGSQELVERWWASPNKAFDGAIPDDIWHSDRKKEVINYILDQIL